MIIDILAFGIAKDILGLSETTMSLEKSLSISELKSKLSERFPEFEKLRSFSIAVNQEYQEDDFMIKENDEIACSPSAVSR